MMNRWMKVQFFNKKTTNSIIKYKIILRIDNMQSLLKIENQILKRQLMHNSK
jgi:hypothetical protein